MKNRNLLKYATVLGMGGILVSLLIGSIDPKTGFPTPITVDGQTIEFTWTDDNTDEDLIIYTDKATYTNGLAHAEVYVAVENRSGKDQNIELMGYFRDSRQKVKDVAVLTEVTEEAPVYEEREDCTPITGIHVTPEEAKSPCITVQTQVATTTMTKAVWRPLAQLERTTIEKQLETTKLAEATRKPVEGFIAPTKSSLFTVPTGGVAYYKVLVEFPAETSDNFYFEAVGDKGGYGHLDPWFNASWSYRVSITIDDAQVPSTQTSFPVYVNLADLPADFHTNVKTDGCDIRVVEADETTETAFEVVSYDSGTDTGELHFMADSVTGTGGGDTTFYIYYGNAGASCYATTDTYGRNNVWSGVYVAVWHGNESSGNILSSTGNNTGTDTNTVGSAAGKLGNGRNFVRASSEYFVTTNANQTGLGITGNAITMSCWAKGDASLNNAIGRIFWRLGGTGSYGYQLSTSGNIYSPNNAYLISAVGTGGGFDYGFGTAGDATSGTFKHVVATYDGTNFRGYVNTSKSTSATKSNHLTNANAIDFYISGNLASYYDDVLDECRIASNVKTDNWITTEYNNQNTPATFYAVGSQETNTPAAIPEPDDSWFN